MSALVILSQCLFRTTLSVGLGVGLLHLGALYPIANAQQAGAGIDKALGNWTFQSVPYRDNTCQMSGTMQIRPDAKTGTLSCAFTAIEACIGQEQWIVQQTCSVERNGNQIAMRSSIINFIEADVFTDSYMPDHFILNVDSSTKMTGQLISTISAQVEFVKLEENVS